jgi:quinolinate synthase
MKMNELVCPICGKRNYRWKGFCNVHQKIFDSKVKEFRRNFIEFMKEKEIGKVQGLGG